MPKRAKRQPRRVESIAEALALPEVRKFRFAIPPDFADPTVLQKQKNRKVMVALATQDCVDPNELRNLQLRFTLDGGKTWTKKGYALTHTEPGWEYWAPQAVNGKVHNKYWITYTVHDPKENTSSVWLASADSIEGPYTPEQKILTGPDIMCIDPSITFDPLTGMYFLVEGSGWQPGRGIRLWIFHFAKDPKKRRILGGFVKILDNKPGDLNNDLYEGAQLRVVPGAEYPYQIIFSGTNFRWNYTARIVVAKSPFGPYISPPGRESNIILRRNARFSQTGQMHVFNEQGDFIYHARRRMYLHDQRMRKQYRLREINGVLKLRKLRHSRKTYELEHSRFKMVGNLLNRLAKKLGLRTIYNPRRKRVDPEAVMRGALLGRLEDDHYGIPIPMTPSGYQYPLSSLKNETTIERLTARMKDIFGFQH